VVAESIEDAVGGDETWSLSDEGCAAFFEGDEELIEGELSVEAGNGFEFVEGSAGVAEGAAGDHGNTNAGDAVGVWRGEACGGENGSDEERGFVADTSGGVLIDGEGEEGGGVEGFAGVAHGGSESGELLRVEAVMEDGHKESSDLCVGNELFFRSAMNEGMDKSLDLFVAEDATVAFVEEDVDGVYGLGHLNVSA